MPGLGLLLKRALADAVAALDLPRPIVVSPGRWRNRLLQLLYDDAESLLVAGEEAVLLLRYPRQWGRSKFHVYIRGAFARSGG